MVQDASRAWVGNKAYGSIASCHSRFRKIMAIPGLYFRLCIPCIGCHWYGLENPSRRLS
jgi:hypothetical protein